MNINPILKIFSGQIVMTYLQKILNLYRKKIKVLCKTKSEF